MICFILPRTYLALRNKSFIIIKEDMPKLSLSNFYVRSGIFTILSMGGALLNYALYPTLARILEPASFGNFTAIMALSNQILAILLAFNLISIYLVKRYPEEEARDKAQAIQKILIWFFMAATLIVLMLTPVLGLLLKIDNLVTFIILALLLLAAVPAVIWTGYLQGHKRLVQVGVYAFTGALFKLIAAALFGYLWGAVAALWGALIGILAAITVLWMISGVKLPGISSIFTPLSKDHKKLIKNLTLYVAQAIFVVGGLGILQNLDIIYAKAFFDLHTAGIYSGISILSNAVYYLAFLLIWIILPEIDPKNLAVNKRVVSSAYRLLAILAAITLSIEFIFKDSLTRWLLGSQFGQQGEILIYATIFQVSLVAVTLYAFYLLVIRSIKSLYLGLSVIVPCLIFPFFYGDSPRQMIISLWGAVWAGIAIYLLVNMFLSISRVNESRKAA